jgi:hypothetical protein
MLNTLGYQMFEVEPLSRSFEVAKAARQWMRRIKDESAMESWGKRVSKIANEPTKSLKTQGRTGNEGRNEVLTKPKRSVTYADRTHRIGDQCEFESGICVLPFSVFRQPK